MPGSNLSLSIKTSPLFRLTASSFLPIRTLTLFGTRESQPRSPIPEPTVHLPDKPIKDEPVDTSGQRLRAQLLRKPDVIYKRNLLRQNFGSLEVKEYLGVGQSDSLTRYWYCLCKIHGRYIVATQAELVTETVTCCRNAREHSEKIEFRGARLP